MDCHAFEFMQRALQDLRKSAYSLDARVSGRAPRARLARYPWGVLGASLLCEHAPQMPSTSEGWQAVQPRFLPEPSLGTFPCNSDGL